MAAHGDQWYDDAAGPVVRPYAMTRGRTHTVADAKLDLIALVVAESRNASDFEDLYDQTLAPEHMQIIEVCRVEPMSVAEVAADTDLPVGVVRVLIGDLMAAELVRVSRPVPPAQLPDERILREVINGLRAL